MWLVVDRPQPDADLPRSGAQRWCRDSVPDLASTLVLAVVMALAAALARSCSRRGSCSRSAACTTTSRSGSRPCPCRLFLVAHVLSSVAQPPWPLHSFRLRQACLPLLAAGIEGLAAGIEGCFLAGADARPCRGALFRGAARGRRRGGGRLTAADEDRRGGLVHGDGLRGSRCLSGRRLAAALAVLTVVLALAGVLVPAAAALVLAAVLAALQAWCSTVGATALAACTRSYRRSQLCSVLAAALVGLAAVEASLQACFSMPAGIEELGC